MDPNTLMEGFNKKFEGVILVLKTEINLKKVNLRLSKTNIFIDEH